MQFLGILELKISNRHVAIGTWVIEVVDVQATYEALSRVSQDDEETKQVGVTLSRLLLRKSLHRHKSEVWLRTSEHFVSYSMQT